MRGHGEHKLGEERLLEVDLPEGVLESWVGRAAGCVCLTQIRRLESVAFVSSASHLASTLPDEQVGFQLTNANLQGEFEEENHNQLFNTIESNHRTLARAKRTKNHHHLLPPPTSCPSPRASATFVLALLFPSCRRFLMEMSFFPSWCANRRTMSM